MNTAFFIAKKLIFSSSKQGQFSKPIIRIANIAVALGLAVMIITVSIVTGFQQAIRDKVAGFGAHVQITNFDDNNSGEPLPIASNQAFLEDLKKHPNIKSIQPFIVKNGIIKTQDEIEGVVLKGVDSSYNWNFLQTNLTEGRLPNISSDSISKDILISKIVASRLHLKIGDKLFIYFVTQKKDYENSDSAIVQYEQRIRDFKICGIFDTGLEDFDKKSVWVDIQQLQKINYWPPNQIAGFEILLHTIENLNPTADYISTEIGPLYSSKTIQQANPTIFSWLDLQDMNAIIVIALMIIVASINMIATLLILILEQTNLIGILKAIGAKNFTIRKIFLYHALYILFVGILAGNILGIGLCFLQQKFEFLTLAKETYYLSVVPINIDFVSIGLLNLLIVICCILFLIIPSYIISKISPIKSIKFE
ncbi:MAG: ABC transporter permease [Bacteroidetes bacterium]|nr:ABC transporter permease [Bacteroidota bacterium]